MVGSHSRVARGGVPPFSWQGRIIIGGNSRVAFKQWIGRSVVCYMQQEMQGISDSRVAKTASSRVAFALSACISRLVVDRLC